MLKLYNERATWWSLLSPPEDYADEAECFWRVFSDVGLPSSPSLLALGCGGGSNAFRLKTHFAHMTLTDLSAHMLVVSRALNPDCEHLEGDMRTLWLGRLFDVVFIHDAIDYMTTPQDLRQAMATPCAQCQAGGMALFVPDHVHEAFQPSTAHGGRDGKGRALRYLEWAYDSDDHDTSYVVEFVYLLREDTRPSRVAHEQHLHGLFTRAEWFRLLFEVGLQAKIVRDPSERDMFVARRP